MVGSWNEIRLFNMCALTPNAHYLRLCEAVQVGHSLLSVSERAGVFVRTIARAHMKLECSNVAQIFILISSGAGMFFRSKGKRSTSQGQ